MAAEQSETDSVIEHEVRVAGSPDSVFEYFTDPAKMVQWMGVEATLDPRPGGVCRTTCGQAIMLGEFVEVDRPRRIVFTWGWETAQFKTPPQSTLVEVSLTPDGKEMAKSYDDSYKFIFNKTSNGYYAGKETVNYGNIELSAVTYCEGQGEMVPGNYIIEISCDGAVIGNTNLKLD